VPAAIYESCGRDILGARRSELHVALSFGYPGTVDQVAHRVLPAPGFRSRTGNDGEPGKP
jgi:hypothetical protein